MQHNLAQLPRYELDKMNVDLAAAGVAFKERYQIPVQANAVEQAQPAALHDWFRERLVTHRMAAKQLGTMPSSE